MSEDFDLFGLPRGRKGEPRKAGPGVSPGSRPLGRPPRYGHGSFLTRINRSVAKAYAAKGTNRYSRSKPRVHLRLDAKLLALLETSAREQATSKTAVLEEALGPYC